MTPLSASGPNAEQIEYWNDESGANWVALQEALDAQIEVFGAAALERAEPRPGESVLDVGCGCGATSLELARAVGPSGRVLGADLSAPMLERARERAAEADLTQIDFLNADAQTHAFEPESFDLVFSRFGVMFFEDPVAAFANLGRALRPGGRVCFVCWRPPVENGWVTVPMAALASLLPLPAPPPPGEPGPFSFGDGELVGTILERAGFATPEVQAFDAEVSLGGGLPLDQAAGFMLSVGPVRRALADAGPEDRARVLEAVTKALAPHASGKGVVLGGAVWVVHARRGS